MAFLINDEIELCQSDSNGKKLLPEDTWLRHCLVRKPIFFALRLVGFGLRLTSDNL